jgi:hypothetical protein
MLKRIPDAENTILCFQIREGLYTLAQLRGNNLMEFFDVFSNEPTWQGVDLNRAPIIFCAYAAEKRFKPLITEVVSPDVVQPNTRAVPRRMLSSIIEANEKYGANLVELDESLDSVNATLIKADLDPVKDRQAIYDHELTGMIGATEKLRTRLLRFFDTGVNWDDAKSFLFKGIPLPPPSRASGPK